MIVIFGSEKLLMLPIFTAHQSLASKQFVLIIGLAFDTATLENRGGDGQIKLNVSINGF
jgi:hypothetical protein